MDIFQFLKIKPNNEELYIRAFTHTSYGNENDCPNYERLEFLGDKVLDFIISEYLYKKTHLREGDMTTLRANFVCEEALYTYATSLNFEKYILIASSLKNKINKSILADVFEAFIGALYLDKGLNEVYEFLGKIVFPYIEDKEINFLEDYKSLLQNYVQTIKQSVIYETVNETGPAHNKMFTCVAIVDGIVMGKGIAHSKKQAEQKAAREALGKKAKLGD